MPPRRNMFMAVKMSFARTRAFKGALKMAMTPRLSC